MASENAVSGSQHWGRCLICHGDVQDAQVLYRVRVQRNSYVSRSYRAGPRMVRAGREALGGYVICAPCWERLPGAAREDSGVEGAPATKGAQCAGPD